MHKIKINQKPYDLASSWEEVTPQDWDRIAPYIIADDIYNPEVLYLLISRKRWGFRRRISTDLINALDPGQLFDLYNCISWIKDVPCTEPPFKSRRLGWKRYHLPASEFKYMTVIEYAILDLCYQVYQRLWQSKNFDLAEEWAAKLVSYMARPLDKKVNPNDPNTFEGERRENSIPSFVIGVYRCSKMRQWNSSTDVFSTS